MIESKEKDANQSLWSLYWFNEIYTFKYESSISLETKTLLWLTTCLVNSNQGRKTMKDKF